MASAALLAYLDDCRTLVVSEIESLIPQNRYRPILYDLVLDYPTRGGKAFRPALCIATCRAHGGRLQDVLRTAAVLELFHNAFLVHDDIEDGSELRRGEPTLHQDLGVPIAINVGDASFVLCLQPLLDNTQLIGLGKALKILQLITDMARESVEGQAIELDWIYHNRRQLRERDYYLMCYKKTCWYTFIAPLQIGALVAGADPKQLRLWRKFATYLGLAFQIRDDVLNLVANEKAYGKEIGGDLWEGKHTLILLQTMARANQKERAQALDILARPRAEKSAGEVSFLFDLVKQTEAIPYAAHMADRFAAKATAVFEEIEEFIQPTTHRDFLRGMALHVAERVK